MAEDSVEKPGKKRTRAPSEKAIGGNGYTPPSGSPVDRLSPSRVVGGQAASSGDHNAAAFADPMNQPGPRQQAYEHRALREQSSTTIMPWQMLSTRNGDNEFHDRDIVYTRGTAQVSQLHVPDIAGFTSQLGDNAPSGNPALRGLDHQSRGSATPPNGSHSLASPQSNAVAMKASERRDIMRRAMFPGSGGAR